MRHPHPSNSPVVARSHPDTRNPSVVVRACASAGIAIGTIILTTLGLEFTGVVLAFSGHSLLAALVLTVVAGILSGVGPSTTPAYTVQVALLVPALVKLGVAVEAAHLFVRYLVVLSATPPPVAMAVYAANGISRNSPMQTSWAAVKLGLTGHIIPFMFMFAPSLLPIGDWPAVALAVVTATVGVTCLAGGLNHSFFFGPTRVWESAMLVAVALALIEPGRVVQPNRRRVDRAGLRHSICGAAAIKRRGRCETAPNQCGRRCCTQPSSSIWLCR